MITALSYLVHTVVIGVFAYKCYSVGYGKKVKNSFANYLFWASLFIAIAGFKLGIMVAISTYTSSETLLFWTDFTNRPLYYISSIFAVQIPLYKYYPNFKRRFIFSYIAAVVGIGLVAYQFINRTHPVIGTDGIVYWHADMVLAIGMAFLMLVPWMANSYVFIREFIKSKSRNLKSLFLGFGFLLIVIGVFFQEYVSGALLYIVFSIVSLSGYLLALAGLYYEEN